MHQGHSGGPTSANATTRHPTNTPHAGTMAGGGCAPGPAGRAVRHSGYTDTGQAQAGRGAPATRRHSGTRVGVTRPPYHAGAGGGWEGGGLARAQRPHWLAVQPR